MQDGVSDKLIGSAKRAVASCVLVVCDRIDLAGFFYSLSSAWTFKSLFFSFCGQSRQSFSNLRVFLGWCSLYRHTGVFLLVAPSPAHFSLLGSDSVFVRMVSEMSLFKFSKRLLVDRAFAKRGPHLTIKKALASSIACSKNPWKSFLGLRREKPGSVISLFFKTDGLVADSIWSLTTFCLHWLNHANHFWRKIVCLCTNRYCICAVVSVLHISVRTFL